MTNKITKIDLNICVIKPFANLVRPKVVLVVPVLSDRRIAIGLKKDYLPPGLARFLGGGVREDEDFVNAAQREMQEEINILVPIESFKEIAEFMVSATDENGVKYSNTTKVFSFNVEADNKLVAGDDVSGSQFITTSKLKEIAKTYLNLPKTLWYIGEEGEFGWADYAKVYGPVHEIVANTLDTIK
jgi:8-oxo-dGTP pyrophosphatase MutT (NUDIX family)